MKRLCVVISVMFIYTAVFADDGSNASDINHEKAHWNFRAGSRYARIFKEMSDRITTRNGYPIFSFEVGRNTSPSDNNTFDRDFNYPTYGIGTSIACIGILPPKISNGHLKNIYNLYGFLEPDLVRWENFSIGLKGDFGLAYTSGVYDPVKNPGNSWMGSNVLIYYGAGPTFKFYPVPNWEIGLNAMVWHHSNGRTMLPNWGVNEYGVELSARYYMEPTFRGGRRDIGSTPYKGRFVFDIFGGAEPYVSFAVFDAYAYELEKITFDDPSYSPQFDWPLKPAVKAQVGCNLLWKYSRIAASGITIEGLYYSNPEELRHADLVIAELHPDRFTRQQVEMQKYSPFYACIGITQELQYRRVIIFATAGVHIGRHFGLGENMDDTIFYQSAGGRYLIPGLDGAYVSFACKVRNFGRADNLEFCIGKRF